jgi:hypothetical protein
MSGFDLQAMIKTQSEHVASMDTDPKGGARGRREDEKAEMVSAGRGSWDGGRRAPGKHAPAPVCDALSEGVDPTVLTGYPHPCVRRDCLGSPCRPCVEPSREVATYHLRV